MDKQGIRSGEKGYSLLEFLVSLPVLLMLLAGLGTAFTIFLRGYFGILGNWEVQEQVRFSMQRIVRDLQYAIDADTTMYGTLDIRVKGKNAEETSIVYKLYTDDNAAHILKRNKAGYGGPQPITGGSILADVSIVDFHCYRLGRIVFIVLEGENKMSKYYFSLESAVCLPNVLEKGHE